MDTVYIREVIVKYKKTKKEPFKITDSSDASKFIKKHLPDNSREHFVCLYLDGQHAVIAYAIVSSGIANQTTVHAREIFQRAVLCGAIAVLIAHNHPSGNTSPSKEDIATTTKISDASSILGIKLLDHVIVTGHSYFSFQENGLRI